MFLDFLEYQYRFYRLFGCDIKETNIFTKSVVCRVWGLLRICYEKWGFRINALVRRV